VYLLLKFHIEISTVKDLDSFYSPKKELLWRRPRPEGEKSVTIPLRIINLSSLFIKAEKLLCSKIFKFEGLL